MIEIDNQTPWDTVALAQFLESRIGRVKFKSITVTTLRATPGVKREEQPYINLAGFQRWQPGDSSEIDLDIRLISPKRCKDRTDVLDRLSMTSELKAHEIFLPPQAMAWLDHALRRLVRRTGGYACYGGYCDCQKISDVEAFDYIIPGDTKARSTPPPSLEKLQAKLDCLENSIRYHEEKIQKFGAQAGRLRKRISKMSR